MVDNTKQAETPRGAGNGAGPKPYADWPSAADIEEKSPDWLWYPYLVAEGLNILAGMGGEGKGLVCAHIAACVTIGSKLPFSDQPISKGHVLWCETEDDPGFTLKPRLLAAGADCSKVTIIGPEEFYQVGDTGTLRQFIIEKGTRLIVLSPLASFLGSGINLNDEIEVRRAIGGLIDAVEGTGCTIIGIRHASKKADLSSLERVLGSVAFVNLARSVLLVASDEGDPDTRRLVHAKRNLSIKGPDLLYTPVYNGDDPKGLDQRVRLDWEKTRKNVDAGAVFDRRASRQSAREWLEDYLTKHGKTLQKKVLNAAMEAGFTEYAIRKAHQRGHRFRTEQDGFQGPRSWWIE